MKPAAFDYARPGSKQEALELLAGDQEEIRVLAGGQSLMAVLNIGLARPELLIDISRLEELDSIAIEDDRLVVGATVTQTTLMSRAELADEVPLVSAAMPVVGHAQTRNRGTVCGSVAHADPSAELPLCLVTLGGEIELESLARGVRRVAAREFFKGILTTARHADELITGVHFPLRRDGSEHRFREVAIRHGDFAIVALASVTDDTGASLGIGGVGDRPVHHRIEADADPAEALNRIAWSLGAQSDLQATAAYRRQLVRELGAHLLSGEPA